MSDIKVSIIVPAYNVEEYIEKCLDSLVNQTLKEIEIIVINDGSKDKTLDIIKKFDTDTRIKIIDQENAGLSCARNAGLQIAQGEYIGFVDSDDYVDIDYYEKLYNTANKYNSDIAITSILKHKPKYDKYNVIYKEEKVANSINAKIRLCEDNTHRPFYVWNKIYKKSLLDNNHLIFPAGRVFEDVLFNLKAIFYANKIVSVPNLQYHYVERSNSIVKSKDKSGKKKNDHIIAYTELQEFAQEHNIKLPERLNYTESYWKGPLKIYKGRYKMKALLFGITPIYRRHNNA